MLEYFVARHCRVYWVYLTKVSPTLNPALILLRHKEPVPRQGTVATLLTRINTPPDTLHYPASYAVGLSFATLLGL